MTKESKTKTIEEILDSIKGKENREKIEKIFDTCLKSINCEDTEWKAFKVYSPSVPLMKTILKAMAPEYIMAIADELGDISSEEVKISLVKAKETSIWTVRRNDTEMIVVISISEKRLKKLQKKL